VLAPYTKVEETPGLHAVHDILKFGAHPRSIAKVCPVAVSSLTAPILTAVRARGIPRRRTALSHPFPRHRSSVQAAPHRSAVFGVHHHRTRSADHQCVGALPHTYCYYHGYEPDGADRQPGSSLRQFSPTPSATSHKPSTSPPPQRPKRSSS
jgi:hypothetical protein